MAKRDAFNQTHQYYVYYDKASSKILSITNEKTDKYEYGIEVDLFAVEKFLNGTWHFKDYIVAYPVNSSELAIMSIIEYQGYRFNNNLFEWILESDKDAEFIVEWDGPNQAWNFVLDKQFKKVYNNNITTPVLLFFVTLETDLDFLIRTVPVKVDDLLMLDKVVIPFENNLEKNIGKISISSKMIFKNYKLKVIHD